jgi:hypothetical protein
VNEPRRLPFWKRWLAALRGEGQKKFVARFAAVVLIIVFVGATAFLVSRYQQGQTEAERQTYLQQKLNQLNDPQHPNSELLKTSSTVRADLMPTLIRGTGEMPRIPVTAEASVVQVRIGLPPEQYQSYRATLRTIEGKEIFTLPSLPVRMVNGNRELLINIPAEMLPYGDYELNLIGLSPDGKPTGVYSYLFRVVR